MLPPYAIPLIQRKSYLNRPFAQLFLHHPKVDAGLAASIFHRKEVDIRELKEWLRTQGVNMRL